MKFEDIALILVSGIGLFHGVFAAFYCWFLNQKRSISNTLLGLLLIFFAYRVGKSVARYFMDRLDFIIIFSGLAIMLAIGPTLYLYFKSLTKTDFKLRNKHLLHFIPTTLGLILSATLSYDWLRSIGTIGLLIMIVLYYGQFLTYIILSNQVYRKTKRIYKENNQVKENNKLFIWMRAIIIGVSFIYLAYVFNIIEDTIPYITGPVLYSIVIYMLTFYAVRLDILKFKIQPIIPQHEIDASKNLFEKITKIVENNERFLDPNLSLATLASEVKISSHQLSNLINEHAKKNFNDFINYYRIRKSQYYLGNQSHAHLTISSIAFESGFNSLSSFNSSFKKVNGITPSVYRKSKLKEN